MKNWAEVYDGFVRGIHSLPNNFKPEFNPSSLRFIIDLTGVDPQPYTGWKCLDADNKIFSEPDPVPQNPITSKAFFERFIGAEREALVDSALPKVKQFILWMQMTGDVDLSDLSLSSMMTYLENHSIIAAGRGAEILTIYEV